MQFFYILVGVAAIGIIFVIWVLFTEKPIISEENVQKIEPDQLTNDDNLSSNSNFDEEIQSSSDLTNQSLEELLGTDIGESKKKKKFLSIFFTKKPKKIKKTNDLFKATDFNEKINQEQFKTEEFLETTAEKEESKELLLNQTGTANLKTTPAIKDDPTSNSIDNRNAELLQQSLNDLQEKYTKLENLFNEKNKDLAEQQKSLENEISHRKEFDKLKQLLDSEIIELKEKNRDFQVLLNTLQSENQEFKNKEAIIPTDIQQQELKETEAEEIHSNPEKEPTEIIDLSTIELDNTPEEKLETPHDKNSAGTIDLSQPNPIDEPPKPFTIDEIDTPEILPDTDTEDDYDLSQPDTNTNDSPEKDIDSTEEDSNQNDVPTETTRHEVHLMPDPIISDDEKEKTENIKDTNIKEL